MNLRKKVLFALFLMIAHASVACAAEQGYFKRLGNTFVRGVKNVVSCPYEVPYTIKKHDQDQNGDPRAYRDVAGFFDGVFRTLTRLGSGAWDMVWAFVPGDQEGLTLDPETFF